jgi:hypothetical protein
MGYSADCYVVIGVAIKHDDFINETKVRGCSHPEQDAKFCPECGEPMWKNKKNYFSLDELDEYLEDVPDGIRGFTGTCEERDGVIGSIIEYDGNPSKNIYRMVLPSETKLNEIREKLKKLLGDLYDESKFGFYEVFYESY